MNLINLSEQIWNNSIEVEFGNNNIWNASTFLTSWFDDLDKIVPSSPGWYWFSCEISKEDILTLDSVTPLPPKACDFPIVATENDNLFNAEQICRTHGDFLILYNGHEGNVRDRARKHFNLNLTDTSTGALGIKHYGLSNKNWRLKYFTEAQIDSLGTIIQANVRSLINNKTGRVAIENAWRMKYGWPLLCKE